MLSNIIKKFIETGSDDVVEWKKEPIITKEIDVQTICIDKEENNTMTND